MSVVRSWARNFEAARVLLRVLLSGRAASPTRHVGYDDLLRRHFERDPDRPALVGQSGRLSWGELDALSNRIAHWALGEGLSRGDTVALLMENRPEYVATWLGLSRIGVVTALLNTNLRGESLAHCLREADTRHCIVGTELLGAAASALPALGAPLQLFRTGPQRIDPEEDESKGPPREAVEDLDAALAAVPGTAVDPAHRRDQRAGDGLLLIYTSGTTGLPKAARISHTKAVLTGYASLHSQGLEASDRTYCCLPLYHSAGGMMAAGATLLSGGTLVIARRFSATRFWSDCTQHDVTSFQYIGELCRYLLASPEHPDERRHHVRVVIGNGLRPDVWVPFQERFAIPRIVEFYGATEGNLALVNTAGKPGAVGQMPRLIRKIVGVELVRYDVEREELVRGPDGFCERVAIGEPGEALIRISRRTRFEGYTNPEATEKKVLRDAFAPGDRYFRTGDLLRVDEEGFFYFVDRIGDTFRWKGENVATSEVAEVLSTCPGIHEANVYGVHVEGADGRAGMAALVVDADFDLDALSRHVESDLPAYARPLFIRIQPEIEITGTFKHRKVDLVRDGFDPRRIDGALYFLDPRAGGENGSGGESRAGGYVPLDAGIYDRIQSGEVRL